LSHKHKADKRQLLEKGVTAEGVHTNHTESLCRDNKRKL